MNRLIMIIFNLALFAGILLAMTAVADDENPVIPPMGRVCAEGCNNESGCSWITNTKTEWLPHVECRWVPYAQGVHCINGKNNVICYKHWRSAGYFGDGSGNVVEYRVHFTPDCDPI